jgi:hypothetical protein
MEKIKFRGQEYKTRTFNVLFGDEERTIKIATESLSDAMGDKKEVHGTLANDIDNTIYYYVEDEVINFSAHLICDKHLDEQMDFISEE